MPKSATIQRAKQDKREGKSASTQAGEFVHEEIRRIRKGAHGARSAKQAIAIGLSKARRAGVKLRPPKKGTLSEKARRSAVSAYRKGQRHEPISRTRSRAMEKALKREGWGSVSRTSLSRQAHAAAMRRTKAQRSMTAKKAARTRAKHHH